MFYTQKRLQKSRLLGHLVECAVNFMVEQSNHETQTESRVDTIGENVAPSNTKHLIPVNGSQIDMQTLGKSSTDRVGKEVDNGVATVGTGVDDAI